MADAARPGRWASVFIVLLLASAAALVIGVAVERNLGHTESAATTGEGAAAHSEAGEAGEGGSHSDEAGTNEGTKGDASSESLLGVNPESTGAVVGAVLVSVLLAAAAWLRPLRPVLLVGVLFCLAAVALDVREVTHQLNENNDAVATLAGLVTMLHLAAAVAAVVAMLGTARPGRVATAAPVTG